MQWKWSKVDPIAKPSSTPVISENVSFADVSDLKLVVPQPPPWANPCELNQMFLDGTQLLYPGTPNYPGIYSTAVSGRDGVFETPPVLTVTFTSPIETAGVTLYFSDVYPFEITLTWYRGTTQLAQQDFKPDKLDYFCSRTVIDYDKCVISFKKTLPGRRLKMWRVDWGQIKFITDKEVISASLTENVDSVSSVIDINTVQLSFLALEDNFNIITNSGEYNLIKTLQPIQNMDGYGTFYISKFSAKGQEINTTLTDLLGVIGDKPYMGGFYNTTVETFINDIAVVADTAAIFGGAHNGFLVDDNVKSLPVVGYLKLTTIRDALHQMCVATCIVLDASRGDKIHLRKKHTVKTADIPDTAILENPDAGLNDFFTTVEVSAYTYTLDAANQKREILNEEKTVGEHTLELTSPHEQFSITGATGTEHGANYFKYTVTTAGTVTVKAYPYTETVVVTTVEKAGLSPGDIRKIKKVERVTLITEANAEAVAQNRLESITREYFTKYKTLTDYETGKNYKANDVTGALEYQKIDLVKGITEAKLYGDYIDNG